MEWKISVDKRNDDKYTAAEKNMMLLASETREGLQITSQLNTL